MIRRNREPEKESTVPIKKEEPLKVEKQPEKVEPKIEVRQIQTTQEHKKLFEKLIPQKIVKTLPPKGESLNDKFLPKDRSKKETTKDSLEKKVSVKEQKEIKKLINDSIPLKLSKKESEYYGIGIIGDNVNIRNFKGLCKIKGLVLGEEIVKMVKKFNEENK